MTVTDTVILQLYFAENERHRGELAYEWVLERGKALGIPGGTALRGIAGYGRHGVLEQEGFFELAANLPIVLQFVCAASKARELLQLLSAERLAVFHTQAAVEAGWTVPPQ